MRLSLIVPCFNECDNVGPFQAEVIRAFEGCGYDYEIVFVNDGSKDTTLYQLKKLYEKQECPVKVVSFSRNFGKESGIFAGIEHASGDYLSVIDADLQQDPALVRQMVEILDEKPEYDMVAAYQDRRNEGKVLSFFKKNFYSLINKMSTVKLKADASDFRTFRRNVADSIRELAEYHRFSKGIFAWVGYETYYIPYIAKPRLNGETKWNFWKLFNYAVEGIIGYSTTPLRFATVLGCISGCAGLIYMIVALILQFGVKVHVSNHWGLVVLILLMSGIQLVCIGIMGEYVGRTFVQSKNRPIYIAKEYLTYESDSKE